MTIGAAQGNVLPAGIRFISNRNFAYGSGRGMELTYRRFAAAVNDNDSYDTIAEACDNDYESGYGDNIDLRFPLKMPCTCEATYTDGAIAGAATDKLAPNYARKGNEWLTSGIFGGAPKELDTTPFEEITFIGVA